jgi:hypothetical protein
LVKPFEHGEISLVNNNFLLLVCGQIRQEEPMTKQEKARTALAKAKEKRWRLREIAEKSGLSIAFIGAVSQGAPLSDESAEKLIQGCKLLGK